jgi:hypothetical protein
MNYPELVALDTPPPIAVATADVEDELSKNSSAFFYSIFSS